MLRDPEAVRLLEDIPADLKARGWRVSRTESSVQKGPAVTWYDAVYTRPFEPGIDDAALMWHHPHYLSGGLVCISTLPSAWSRSWANARDEAVRLMREVDAQRHRRP